MPFCQAIFVLSLVAQSPPPSRGELPASKPEPVGLSSGKLSELKPALRKLVDDGKIAGGVTLIARHGKVASVISYGYRDIASKIPMTEDNIFALASMTKPITCVAAMTLVEQGKMALDDPIAKYLPEMNNLRVRGNPKDDTAESAATVSLNHGVTIRHLMAHSSGFGYAFLMSDKRVQGLYDKAGVNDPGLKTLAEQVKRLGGVPLLNQPGEGWNYGMSHDVLARVVEVVSGQSLDLYVRKHIFSPLGMSDTFYLVPVAKRDRVATIYQAANGKLTPLPRQFGSETFFGGGTGLFSTAGDYARFCQMLLNQGELEGARILKPETVATMTTNQIAGFTGNIMGFFPVKEFGLGMMLTTKPGINGGRGVLEAYGWAGMYSTDFRISPPTGLITISMTQVLPTGHGGANTLLLKVAEAAILK